jgi:hypothetical protein
MPETNDTSPVPRKATRAADADREAVAEQLRGAVSEGRLDLSELDDRLTATYAARTHAELEAVTADLPAPRAADIRPLDLKTRSGSLEKVGYWTVPATIVAECTSGTIKIDFTEAVCAHREVTIQASATSGSLELIVPRGWTVNLDNVTTNSGSLVNKVRQRPAPDAPLLRVDGQVKSGTIKARYPRRSFWQWLLRRQW